MESSTFSKICEIKNRISPLRFYQLKETSLHEYMVGLDDLRTTIYISAEVNPDSLDTGSDQTTFKCYDSGDQPALIIGKQLGGEGDRCNVFPLNKQLDISWWKDDENQVYAHVKLGKGNYARLVYGIEINRFFSGEISRAFRIHYFFQLFEKDDELVNTIEGMFENSSPKLTKEDYYKDNYGCIHPHPSRDDYKFDPYIFTRFPSDEDD